MLFFRDPDDLSLLLTELEDDRLSESEVAERIDERFGQDLAVLVLDMSGFSSTTQRRGVVAFLRLIHEMQRIVAPIVRREAGRVVNTLADSLCCVFPDVGSATRAARSMVDGTEAANDDGRSTDLELHVSIGIGWGRVLVIGEQDIFGDQVNLAAKLGEDIADGGQVLLTEAARIELPDDVASTPLVVSVSGLELPYHLLEPVAT